LDSVSSVLGYGAALGGVLMKIKSAGLDLPGDVLGASSGADSCDAGVNYQMPI
jgi:hypothetical protein